MKLTITPVAAAAIIVAATTTLAAPVPNTTDQAVRHKASTSTNEQTSLKRRWNLTELVDAKGPLIKLFNDDDPKYTSIDTLIKPQPPSFPASGGYPSTSAPKGTTSPGYPHGRK